MDPELEPSGAASAALRETEAKYRALFESIDEGFCIIEVLFDERGEPADYVFLETNPAFVKQTGLEDAVGRRMRELVPAHEAHWFEIYGRVATTGEPVRFQQPAEALARFYDVFAFRIGEPSEHRVAVLFADISEERSAQRENERLLRELEVERSRLAYIFQQAPAFLAVLRGPQHVFELANEAYFQLVGRRDIIGKPVREALPEVRGQGFEALLDHVLETGEPYVGREIRVRLARTPGAPPEERFADFVYLPLVEADGTRSGVIAHGTDITEQVLARREAERARHEADEANRAKSAFLATMSHEIRTPINAILGYAQLMELGVAGPVTEQQRDYLTRLVASSEHLRGLVDDILDLAKIDAGGITIAREHGATGPLVDAALDLVRPQASAKGVRLVNERAGDAGEPFVGDQHRVRQILANLLSNAVKFTEPGGTVSVGCGRVEQGPPATALRGEGPWAFIAVRDTGVGIPADEQARVFEPFHQVDHGHTRQQGGTGLGLAISRQLARLMGGDLTLESAFGKGSTFTLWLPAAAAERSESAAERGARAREELGAGRVLGLAEIGTYLRARAEDLIRAYAARLRADPAFSQARRLRQSELEDHQLSFLADIAQTLIVIEEAGGPEASDLLRDGSTIQRVVAELHGSMRQTQGWTVDELIREYAILGEEIAAVVRRRAPQGAGDISLALEVLGRLVERAQGHGVAALRRAGDERGG